MRHPIHSPSLVTDADRALRLSREVEALRREIAEADEHKEHARRLQRERHALACQVEALEAEVESVRGEGGKMRTRLAELAGEVDALRARPTPGQLKKAQTQAAEAARLRGELTEARQHIDRLQQRLDELSERPTQDDVALLKLQLLDAEQQRDAARAEVERLQQRYAGWRARREEKGLA